jgi:hypothetical protein
MHPGHLVAEELAGSAERRLDSDARGGHVKKGKIGRTVMHGSSSNPHIGIRVECYAGHRGEQTPRRFHLGERGVEIADVLDQWLAPDHRYFKVRGAEGAAYLLRHDVVSGLWELIMYERRAERT